MTRPDSYYFDVGSPCAERCGTCGFALAVQWTPLLFCLHGGSAEVSSSDTVQPRNCCPEWTELSEFSTPGTGQ